MTKRPIPTLIALLLLGIVATARGEQVDFRRDVRPILSDNCFFCHGPETQEADLRLDQPPQPRARVIVPGNLDESKLITKIFAKDPAERMPPPDANRTLTAKQKETLKAWVAAGGAYQEHWAFVTPKKTWPQLQRLQSWPRHRLDRFVAARLEAKGLRPNPPAARETWLRRVTLDLSGLPPTPAERDAFLSDTTKAAHARVVDRLLAAPSFGEQMAVPWLDVARYADTFGYDNDREMHVWPWRDWLIAAFNTNMPFDRFLREQLAGDLLNAPTQDQVLATTFNRLHRQNAEGGALPEEFQVEYVADRTHTFASAFLGLTLECARCHDHKFDPLSQRDYYALAAYFNNIDEAGVYAEKTGATPSPSAFLYEDGQRARHARAKQTIRKLEQQLQQAEAGLGAAFAAWKRPAQLTLPQPISHLRFDSRDKLPRSAQLIEGPRGRAARFDGDAGVSLANTGAFERTQPFSLALWLRPPEQRARMVLAHNSKPNWEAGRRGLELILDAEGHIEFGLGHFWPGNALRVVTKRALPPAVWTHLAITYDGSSRARGVRVFLDGAPADTRVVRDGLKSTIRFRNPPPFELAVRSSELGFRGGGMDEWHLFALQLSAAEVAELAGAGMPSSDNLWREHFRLRITKATQGIRRQLQEAREAENVLVGQLRTIMVMREKSSPAQARLLHRGDYQDPREALDADVPEVILKPAARPTDRLQLADWLTDPEHPLTARVAVNRIWAHFFGQGLVTTVDDFGSQGASPSHPQLLDTLAREFIESGWDIKALCREMVLSATYRQSARHRSDLDDPENRWLARGPRRRLTAEEVRDAALSASGLLVRRLGGPSVKPYQPSGLWKETGPQSYQEDRGEGLYRRSLYTFWKRTAPPPAMIRFDARSREVCVPRRSVTLTVSQSLILLNGPQFVEASRALAVRAREHDQAWTGVGVPDVAMREAFLRLLSREPGPRERDVLRRAYAAQLHLFGQHPDAAKAFLGVGRRPHDSRGNSAELAALTSVVQTIMNLLDYQRN